MLSLRHPKSLVAAAIVFCALLAALPSAGSRLSQKSGSKRILVAKVLCVETRGGDETRGDVKARKRRCQRHERRISFPRGERGRRGFTGAAGPARPRRAPRGTRPPRAPGLPRAPRAPGAPP